MWKAINALLALCSFAIIATIGYYSWTMSYRDVTESQSWVSLDTARQNRKHLFEDFPPTTREIRYSNSVVGLRGWCFVYAVRAPLADLHAFATQQLNQYSGNVVRTNNFPFPFAEGTPIDLHIAYSVNVNWLTDAQNAVGVKYALDSYAGPTVFIDESSETMFYVCTD